ncbi:MAG: prephenate dehydrogenase [Chloroflexota bacterium]|nr:prephenate dehydrogenase [Chloroflexota bacterium]
MRLSESTVAVVGLGLMGGSLALALRGKCTRLVGVARRTETIKQALRTGVVDAAVCNAQEAAAHADIVVLSTPVRHILAAIPEVTQYMRKGALLIDLGSTKSQVVQAMNGIPQGVAAVGGHPMCGKEVGGLESADAAIYRGATFVLTPTERTTDEAMRLARELAEATGARPLLLDAERHDKAVAMVSHMPYLLASALAQAESQARALDPVTGTLAASGFRDTSRLAASQVDMMLSILLTNREPVKEALGLFREKLLEVERLLDTPNELEAWMSHAQGVRREMFQ